MTPRNRSAPLFAAVALVAGVAARGAVVDVAVVERGGGPLPNQFVFLYLMTPEIQADGLYFENTRPAGYCSTGPTGRCRIADLGVGVYFPYLPAIVDANLCAPVGPPMIAFGTVTLLKSNASAALRIELQRGVRILFKVVSGKAAIPPRSRIELASDSGEKAVAGLDGGGNGKITLGSGRWLAHLSGPAGANVIKVERDGVEVDTLDVPIELEAPSSDRFITWTLSPPCRVRGLVTSTSTPPSVAVEATLVTPGPWGASKLCRATDCAGAPLATLDPKGNFVLEVPSGTWRIAPVGESLLESSPPFLNVTCEGGEDLIANFSVREKPDSGPKTVLRVQVVNADDRPIGDARVEAWPPTGKAGADTPIETETTGRHWMPADFTKLAAGSYLLRARAAGYVTTVQAVTDLDPEARVPRYATIRLDKGATIDALVTDGKNRPTTDVGLVVKWIETAAGDNDPAARLAEPDAEISVPPTKDQTGHVVVTGLAAGEYDVTPVLSGTIATAAVASIAVGDGPRENHVVVKLAGHDVQELSVRLLPAASLAGQLVCADFGLFPHQADFCLLGMPQRDEDELTREGCKKPVMTSKSIELSGKRHDTFQVGPLTDGSFRLGLRPSGYAQWTWVLGTPDGEQAAVVQVNGTDAVELGAIPMLCGPAVELRPNVLSHDPAPDLTLATVVAELTRTLPAGKPERRLVPAERSRDRVMLRELPEGEWTLNVTISHPFFVPAAPVRLSVPVKLERGARTHARFEVAAVGGAIAIEAPAGAARLSGPEGPARVVAAKDGSIAIDGVSPDAYRVELCEDAACARVVRRWDEVRVSRGQKVVLTAAAAHRL